MPHLQGRPLSLKRYPNGIDQDYFFQKDASGFPDWLHREELVDDEEFKTRVICDDKASLLYLANLGCIDQNPYMSRMETLGHPDFILIDLDPYHCGYDRIVEAAQLLREKLWLIGLTGYPKTTGGNGMQFMCRWNQFTVRRKRGSSLRYWHAGWLPSGLTCSPRHGWFPPVRKAKFTSTTCKTPVAKPSPRRTFCARIPEHRWLLRSRGKKLRPDLKPSQFHIANVLRRFERVGDLFAGVLNKPQELGPALEKLGKAMG